MGDHQASAEHELINSPLNQVFWSRATSKRCRNVAHEEQDCTPLVFPVTFGIHLQMINFWMPFNSSWSPHKKAIGIDLKSDMGVIKTDPQLSFNRSYEICVLNFASNN